MLSFRSLALLAVIAFAGCSSKPPVNLPTVHKVTGKVVTAAGAPVDSGTVQFESLATPGKVALGDVQPNGTFSMILSVDGHQLEGTVLGGQRATYLPKMTEDQSGAVPIALAETFDVKEGANDFTIKLP